MADSKLLEDLFKEKAIPEPSKLQIKLPSPKKIADTQLLSRVLKEQKGNKRSKTRLKFPFLEQQFPELAGRTKILRSRVIELEENFNRDIKWAENWFNRVAILVILFPLLATLFAAFYATNSNEPGGSGWPIAIALTALGTMVATGGHAFGWHKRYRAFLSAKWKMTALRTSMDQFLANMAFNSTPDQTNRGLMSDGDRQAFLKECEKWQQKFEAILTSFGLEYGSAVDLPAGGKQQTTNPNGN